MGRWYDTDTETELTTRVVLKTEEVRKKIEKVTERALQRFKLVERGERLSLQIVEVRQVYPDSPAPRLEYAKELMMIETYKRFQVVARMDLERQSPDLGAGSRCLVWIGVRLRDL